MSLTVVEKDITTVTEGVIAHQVNCQGVMGSGVALAIANKYPQVKQAYLERCQTHAPDYLLGTVQYVPIHDELWVANMFGQLGYGTGYRSTSYDAADKTFRILGRWLLSRRLQLYVPHLMGCGLGGGTWAVYEAIIEDHVPSAVCCAWPG